MVVELLECPQARSRLETLQELKVSELDQMMNGIGPVSQSAYSAALAGVQKAQAEMLGAAERIASGDLDTLPESFQQLMVAEHSFAANLKVLDVLDETERHLLDIFA